MKADTKEWDLVAELNNLREMNSEKQNIIDQLFEQIKELQSEVLKCKCKGECQKGKCK